MNLGALIPCPQCEDTMVQPKDGMCRDCARTLGVQTHGHFGTGAEVSAALGRVARPNEGHASFLPGGRNRSRDPESAEVASRGRGYAETNEVQG